jgi:amino acid adenylation domain-containing protein
VAELPLVERFLRVAAQHPDRTAVCAPDGELSFAELDRRSSALATTLRGLGAGAGSRIGVRLPRSTGLVVALLAVWRTGAAYVPLDPGYPEARLRFMAADARVELVVGDDAEVEVVRPGAGSSGPAGGAAAYVIHTSGSTGEPKGVVVSHDCVWSLVGALEEFGAYAGEHRVVAWNASPSFDASVQQWVRVCRGDTVVVLSEEERSSPSRLRAVLERCGVTDIDLTPTHWEMVRHVLLTPFADGRTVRLFIGGEAVPVRAWREIADTGHLEGLNLYGPTECTVDATAAWIAGPEPHLGRPLAGTRLYVCDEQFRPATEGELCISGPRLADGYTGRPGLTAARFVPDPFGTTGTRLYRTGDRVRRAEDGRLLFLGRTDRQVKVRGFRVELDEIERVLAAMPGVARAVVSLRSQRLVAQLLPAQGPLDVDAIFTRLREVLPDHLVPAEIVPIGEAPLTPSGKLDVRALSDVDTRGVREVLVAAWCEALGRDRVEPHDDFFALGGRSLAATTVMARVREALGVRLSVRDVYSNPRLRDLVAHIESVQQKETA